MVQAALIGEVEHVIKSLTGVIGFLGAKGWPSFHTASPMRQVEVTVFLGKVEEIDEFDEQLDIPYIVGETVKVIDGPLITLREL